jgi:hypothetical protein
LSSASKTEFCFAFVLLLVICIFDAMC